MRSCIYFVPPQRNYFSCLCTNSSVGEQQKKYTISLCRRRIYEIVYFFCCSPTELFCLRYCTRFPLRPNMLLGEVGKLNIPLGEVAGGRPI